MSDGVKVVEASKASSTVAKTGLGAGLAAFLLALWPMIQPLLTGKPDDTKPDQKPTPAALTIEDIRKVVNEETTPILDRIKAVELEQHKTPPVVVPDKPTAMTIQVTGPNKVLLTGTTAEVGTWYLASVFNGGMESAVGHGDSGSVEVTEMRGAIGFRLVDESASIALQALDGAKHSAITIITAKSSPRPTPTPQPEVTKPNVTPVTKPSGPAASALASYGNGVASVFLSAASQFDSGVDSAKILADMGTALKPLPASSFLPLMQRLNDLRGDNSGSAKACRDWAAQLSK